MSSCVLAEEDEGLIRDLKVISTSLPVRDRSPPSRLVSESSDSIYDFVEPSDRWITGCLIWIEYKDCVLFSIWGVIKSYFFSVSFLLRCPFYNYLSMESLLLHYCSVIGPSVSPVAWCHFLPRRSWMYSAWPDSCCFLPDHLPPSYQPSLRVCRVLKGTARFINFDHETVSDVYRLNDN